ncbi:hypothetical protein FB45DRAFT_825305 [Roridomyces roridus]|uniref:F-box domain-containing protein n=1 Tax=Roridomyces roridus TaxID=1738132 RepID=A0AAD7C791_9AGAR|nr:hypothetical protein FB45DRAFT_825305 [Roridomyces roridus]
MDAPCTLLPNELVCEIFMHFIPTYPLCPPLTGPESPTTLTHVCREWRAIALAMPKLWRAISLRFADASKVETVRTWLDRSGANPLSIQMETENGYNHAWLSVDMVDAIFLHHHRWEYVKLVLVDSELALIAPPMPILHSLSLEIDISMSDGGFPVISRIDFPSLGVLSLRGFPVSVDWLPWSRLTSLTLEDMYPMHYISALRESVNLIDLTLIDCGGNPLPPQDNLLLPRLETFTMAHTTLWIQLEFDFYLLPALRTLQVPGVYLGDQPIDFLASFISKSGCRLQRVFITGPSRWILNEAEFRSAFLDIAAIEFDREYEWREVGEEEYYLI